MNSAKNESNFRCVSREYTARHLIINYYLVFMLAVFPLFLSDRYFNIRHDRAYLFIAVTGIVIIAQMLIAYVSDTKDKSGNTSENNRQSEKFSFTDYAMIALLAVSFISTLFSKYPQLAIFGEENANSVAGRNNGFLMIALYVGIYFVITRCYYYMEYVFLAVAAGSAVVYLLSVFHFYYFDPFGLYSELSIRYIEDFTSTIGNKNLMSSYICIMLPITVTMSVHTRRTLYRAVYLVSSALGFAALMTADSDSGILGFGVFAVIIFIWYSKRVARLKNYFLCITIMFASAKMLKYITILLNCKTKEIDKFQELFVTSDAAYVLIFLSAAITGVLYIIDKKKPGVTFSKAVPIALGSLAVLGVIAVISAVIYFSCFDTQTELGGFSSILRFNEKWGTHRGFMWIKTFDIFGDFSIFNKIFGTGPDTYYYAFSPYFGGLLKYGDSSTNAAHNEYLNYLITIGAAGLVSYTAVLGSTVVRSVKKSFSNPLAIVCASAVICYSAQAVVNISQPITTPLFILFVALAESVARGNGHNADLI